GRPGHARHGAVAETRPWPGDRDAAAGEVLQGCIPSDGAEREEDAGARQQMQLAVEPYAAAAQLVGTRRVRRRSAAAWRHDERVVQPQPILAVDAGRLVREPGAVERREEEIAAAVAREHAARPVAAVRGGREAQQDEARGRISEPGDGTGPVRPGREPPHFDARHFLAPRHETGASAALDHTRLQFPQRARPSLRTRYAQE